MLLLTERKVLESSFIRHAAMSAVGNAIVLTKPVKVFTGTKTGEIPSPSTDDMTKLLSLISTATSRAVEMTDTGIALQLSPQKNNGLRLLPNL